MLIGEIDGIHFRPLERCLRDLLDVLGSAIRAPFFAKDSRDHGRFPGRVHALNARRAELASKSLKGLTAPGMLLQYPTPRFPRG